RTLQLTQSQLVGHLTDADTGEPIPDANVSIVDRDGSVLFEAGSDDSGSFMFSNFPEDASIRVEAGAYGVVEEPIGGRKVLDLDMELQVVSGSVLDDAGNPVQGAVISSAEARTVT